MLIDFRCRRCRAPLSIEADQKGNTIHCPTCDCEMVVPPDSEPGTPRGQIVQGVYSLVGDIEVRESELDTAPPRISEGAYAVLEEVEGRPASQSQPQANFTDVSGGTLPESSLDSLSPPRKPRKKRQRRAGFITPRPAWRRAPILAGALLLMIVVIGSANYLRGPAGEDGDTAKEALATSDQAWTVLAVAPPAKVQESPAQNLDQPSDRGKAEPASENSKKGPTETRKEESEKTASLSLQKTAGAVKEPALGEGAMLSRPRDAGGIGQSLDGPRKHATPAVKPAENPSSQTAIPVVKRRRNLSEQDLRKELRLAQEIPNIEPAVMGRLVSAQKVHYDTYKTIEREPRLLLKARPDLKTLPVRQGRECRLDKRSAGNLATFSSKLHTLVDNPIPEESDGKHGMPALLQKFLHAEVRGKRPEWLRPEAVPALQQILMQENKSLRWLLVELLSSIPGPEAGAALAKRAIYDLSPEVRAVAIQALNSRPRKEYLQVLLDGLRYPWAPVADHAAEALTALKIQEVVPILVAYLAEPEPNDPVPSAKNQLQVRELVRINHAANCLMCHPPAGTTVDPAAAVVPGLVLIGSRQGPSFGRYGSEFSISLPTQRLFFVRVDTTFFRQDFSVREPVKTPGTDLVSYPRFDYLLRTRKVKEAGESKGKSKSQQREAILFALRELTGTDVGTNTAAWAKLFPPAPLDDQGHPKSW